MDVEQLMRLLGDAIDDWENGGTTEGAREQGAERVAVLAPAIAAVEMHLLRLELGRLNDLLAHLPAAQVESEHSLGDEVARQERQARGER